MRALFMTFGECKGWKNAEKKINEFPDSRSAIIDSEIVSNKLITKIINIFSTQQNYYLPSNSNAFSHATSSSSSFSMLRLLILKTREY